jgi:hypothetical protein
MYFAQTCDMVIEHVLAKITVKCLDTVLSRSNRLAGDDFRLSPIEHIRQMES